MTPPVLPHGSLGGLKGSSQAGMRHTARQRFPNGTQLPNGEIAKSPSWGPDVCCHLKSMGSQLAEIAATQGIKGEWSFKVDDEVEVAPGQQWEVRRDCVPRLVMVEITGRLVEWGRLGLRIVAAKTVRLNP